MATVRPFTALHPTTASVARVAAVPYDVVNAEEARALAQGNPLSFLHVSRAEIDLPPGTPPYSPLVYETAASAFKSLQRDAPLVRDESACLYVYRLQDGDHIQTGVAGAFSLDDYDRGTIKKHERTRQDKEDDRTRHIAALGAQTGLVFLAYRPQAAIDETIARMTAAAPLFDFTDPDGVRHIVWQADPAQSERLSRGFSRVDALYIADGHHRAASAARARDVIGDKTRDGLLAVAFPANQLRILPYHRVVADLAGKTAEALLGELRGRFAVSDGAPAPDAKGHASMYLARRWYTIDLGSSDEGGDPASALDVTRLQDRILTPLLGIGDVRTDPRIDFVGGRRGPQELQRLVDSGRAAVAFSMFPASMADLMRIVDAGMIMPPKSTWFEPKLLDGLLIYEI